MDFLLLVEEDGFEPSKSSTTDLQSAPFGHSGTPPYVIEKIWSWWTDSNPRPADYKSAALPTELHQRERSSVTKSIITDCPGVVNDFFPKMEIFLLPFVERQPLGGLPSGRVPDGGEPVLSGYYLGIIRGTWKKSQVDVLHPFVIYYSLLSYR